MAEAAAAYDRARELFERKGNITSADFLADGKNENQKQKERFATWMLKK